MLPHWGRLPPPAVLRGVSPYLPSSRVHMGRCGAARGGRGGGEARRALSLLPPTRPGRPAPATTGQPAPNSLLKEEGIPGLSHPSASLGNLFSARRPPSLLAPPLHAGVGAAATCASCQPAHRNPRRAHQSWRAPAFLSRRAPPGAAGPLCGGLPRWQVRVTYPDPTWRRGPGRIPEEA